jgi:hypothetical protein
MLERTTSLPPNEAYEELRKILLKDKCKIIEEEPFKSILVEQGSWFGYSPKTFKKIIKFDFIPESTGTRIVSETSWTSSEVAVEILGPVIMGVFLGFLWWLASDMRTYIEGLRSSLGGRILELFGYTGYRQALALINTLELLVFILAVIMIFGVIHDVYCYAKRETVAERFLSLLPSKPYVKSLAPMPSEKLYCAYCGAENPKWASFCIKCGKKMIKPI